MKAAKSTIPPIIAATEAAGTAVDARQLFAELNRRGISYCVWKGFGHIEEALAGETDIDLLVDRRHATAFRSIISAHGCKPIISPPGKQFPSLEDYLGFDPARGSCYHLHVHYRLLMGESLVKSYRLPLEEPVLAGAQLRKGIKVIAPEMEIVIKVIRVLLKYRYRDAVKDILKVRRPGLSAGKLADLHALLAQTDREEITKTLKGHLPYLTGSVIFSFLKLIERQPRAGPTIYRMRRTVKRNLKIFRRLYDWKKIYKYFRADFYRRFGVFRRHFAGKKLATGGLLVAFVGIDGSGKSTMIEEIRCWLSWKLEVETIYLGSGDHLPFSARLAKRLRKISAALQRRLAAFRLMERLSGWIADACDNFFSLALAWHRCRLLKAKWPTHVAGSIVLCDRFPLPQVHQAMKDASRPPMDGPRIAWKYRGRKMGALAEILAGVEQQLYQRILPPDYLIYLRIDLATALRRKPDHCSEEIQPKLAAMETILQAGRSVIEIDARQEFDQVLLQIKKKLWEIL